MSRWFVPERLVRAYKSQPGAVTSWRKKRRTYGRERERERERKRESERERREREREVTQRENGVGEKEDARERKGRSDSHKALHPPLCRCKPPLYGVSSDPRDAGIRKKGRAERTEGENAARRGPDLGIPNSTKPSKNSRKVPFTRLGPSISLAPFPGTPRACGLV